MPSWESPDGVGQFLWLPKSMKNGTLANNSEIKLPAHTGTYVNAPGHVFDHYFDAGFDVDTLNLEVLNGCLLKSWLMCFISEYRLPSRAICYFLAEVMKALHIPKGAKRMLFRTLNTNRSCIGCEMSKDNNLTAEVVEILKIPDHVERVLLITSNSDRDLMHTKEFDSRYTGLTTDGAEWLARNTNIKLVGIDYLSVAVIHDRKPVYKLLGNVNDVILAFYSSTI